MSIIVTLHYTTIDRNASLGLAKKPSNKLKRRAKNRISFNLLLAVSL